MVWGIFGKQSIPTFQETPKHSPHHGHHYQSSFTRWEAGQWGGRTGSNRWPQIHAQKTFEVFGRIFVQDLPTSEISGHQDKNSCQHLSSQEKWEQASPLPLVLPSLPRLILRRRGTFSYSVVISPQGGGKEG